MTALGLLYSLGQGVERDYVKARDWFEKAAHKDEMGAMINLGVLYENGQGVERDYAKAGESYEKAADKGDESAKAHLKAHIEQLFIMEVAGAGRYAEALQLQERLAVKVEKVETKREGKPGHETAQALKVWHGSPCFHENSPKRWSPPIAHTRSFPTTASSKSTGRTH